MQCPDNIVLSGTIEGQLGNTTIPLSWNGTARQAGFPSCSFSLTGTGTPLSADTFYLTYRGNSCLGPVQGADTLRLASPPPNPAPPPPPPSPPPSPNHVGPGPLSVDRARQVVFNTSSEFPHLTRTFPLTTKPSARQRSCSGARFGICSSRATKRRDNGIPPA